MNVRVINDIYNDQIKISKDFYHDNITDTYKHAYTHVYKV